MSFSLEFEPTGKADIRKGKGTPGRAQLYIDKTLVGHRNGGHDSHVLRIGGGVAVGADVGSPIMPDYKAPFAFTGKPIRAWWMSAEQIGTTS